MSGSAIADYLATLPSNLRPIAEGICNTIRRAAPGSVEDVKYGIPRFSMGGRALIYFGVWKKHIGFYPIYRGNAAFEVEIADYRTGKDTVRFSLGEAIPSDLIVKIVQSQQAAVLAGPEQPR